MLEALFKPVSVAVMGASRKSVKVGYKVLNNIINSSFKEKIFSIIPNCTREII